MAVKYRLFYNGNFSIAGNKYTTEPAYDDGALLDDTYVLDDTHVINDTLELADFFDYLLGITAGTTPVTRVTIDRYGNLIAPIINEDGATKEPAYDDTAVIDDTYTLDDAYMIDDTAELSGFLDYLLGVSSSMDTFALVRFGDDKSISFAGIITEGVTF